MLYLHPDDCCSTNGLNHYKDIYLLAMLLLFGKSVAKVYYRSANDDGIRISQTHSCLDMYT